MELQHADVVACHPEFELLKTGFESFLEVLKELVVLSACRHIHEHPHQLVAICLLPMPPRTEDGLTLGGNSAETSFEFAEGLPQQRRGDRATVIKPAREQDVVPPVFFHILRFLLT